MLYIVATPIGNLDDITLRAKRVLGEVDFVIAEDTRRSGILLKYLNISKKITSFHEHSQDSKLEMILKELKSGTDIAYISDAGTPNLSDPGGKLVEAARGAQIEVSPIPGPSALTSLISVAPFSCSKFQFMGYFPKKKGREKMIEYIKKVGCPVFFYESPHRIQKTLSLLSQKLEGYSILIGRELTKVYEEVLLIDLQDQESFAKIISKGEFVFAVVKINTK